MSFLERLVISRLDWQRYVPQMGRARKRQIRVGAENARPTLIRRSLLSLWSSRSCLNVSNALSMDSRDFSVPDVMVVEEMPTCRARGARELLLVCVTEFVRCD